MAPGSLVGVSRSIGQNGNPLTRFGGGEAGATTTLVAVGAVTMVLNALIPNALSALYASSSLVMVGQVWRLFTWPLANPVSFWGVINLLMLYVFGRELEAQIGTSRMWQLFAGIWAALTLATIGLGVALQYETSMLGMGMVEFLVLLLWIAEYPRRPFFFSIPAWVIGVVFVAVDLLQYIAGRNLVGLLGMLVAFVLVALWARRLGLLSDYDFIPGKARPTMGNRKIRKAQAQARKVADQRAKDNARLDDLLDKISAGGIDSLSSGERRELMRLRNRR